MRLSNQVIESADKHNAVALTALGFDRYQSLECADISPRFSYLMSDNCKMQSRLIGKPEPEMTWAEINFLLVECHNNVVSRRLFGRALSDKPSFADVILPIRAN